MPDNQARVSYPGIEQVEAFSGSMGIGITPGQFSLVIKPQPYSSFPEIGDLTLTYNDQTIVFGGCRVNIGSTTVNEGGQVMNLVLNDWRWRWAYETVSVRANVRRKDGSINILTNTDTGGQFPVNSDDIIGNPTRTIPQICYYYLELPLGVGIDASIVDQNLTPFIDWYHVNAAQALMQMIEPLGLTIAVPTSPGNIRIVRLGEGQNLPDGPWTSIGESFQPPPRPKEVVVMFGPSKYEMERKLIYVGLDLNGDVKPLKDLSYAPDSSAPDGGFLDVFDRNLDDLFANDPEGPAKQEKLEAARQSIFKWFVLQPITTKFTHQGLDIRHVEQLLPIDSTLARKRKLYGEDVETDSFIWGIFEQPDETGENNIPGGTTIQPSHNPDTDRRLIYRGGMTVDGQRGIFKASSPIVRYDSAYNYQLADIRARFGCNIRHLYDGHHAFSDFFEPVDPDSPIEQIQMYRPELVHAYYFDGTTNENEIKPEAQYYLDILKNQFNYTPGRVAVYVGWIPVDMDGMIQSFTYEMNASGANLTVQYGTDVLNRNQLSYRERRYYERISQAVKDVDNLQKNLRQIGKNKTEENI